MANHGYVKTKKQMSAKRIHEIISQLNDNVFQNLLDIVAENLDVAAARRNRPTWHIRIRNSPFLIRQCWLKTSRWFEIRHGAGGQFAWWVDAVITNDVAVAYDGLISDDGVGNKWAGKPGAFRTFRSYSEMFYGSNLPAAMMEFFIQRDIASLPPGFNPNGVPNAQPADIVWFKPLTVIMTVTVTMT